MATFLSFVIFRDCAVAFEGPATGASSSSSSETETNGKQLPSLIGLKQVTGLQRIITKIGYKLGVDNHII